MGLSGLTISDLKKDMSGDQVSPYSSLTSDSVSIHNFSLSTLSKGSLDENPSFTSSNGGVAGYVGFSQQHCPPSVATLDQFSPERQNWVRECPNQSLLTGGPTAAGVIMGNGVGADVFKSGRAWDMGNHHQSSAELVVPGRDFLKTGYYNPNEATGLALVKPKATSKLFDIECSLRIGNVERTSHPTWSFKDNPGNTATMNKIFLFDVEEAFQLEIEVTGTPIATKFGTMAGFSNTQPVSLGYLHLPLALEPLEKSVRTYKPRRSINSVDGSNQPLQSKAQSKEKIDCEIVVMIGVHVLEEPVDDRSWEKEILLEGHLIVMTRGLRMAAWKRYWAVLQGNAVKLYNVEYQTVDVGSNGFALVISPAGIDMTNASESDLASNMDNNIYAFTDSAHLHESRNLQLERAMEIYRENMARRKEILEAKRNRSQRRGNGGHGGVEGVEGVEEEGEEEVERLELIDMRFVS
ncbi:hypothetical protein BGW39_006502 [Mortierella sp. 14UC]|nr:hypothetical protein BGW39_006502 [Mortierella sp. 14UC]